MHNTIAQHLMNEAQPASKQKLPPQAVLLLSVMPQGQHDPCGQFRSEVQVPTPRISLSPPSACWQSTVRS